MAMAEYIKREALIELFRCAEEADVIQYGAHISDCFPAERAIEFAKFLPTADVVEVVHGRWEYHDCVCTGDGLAAVYACSNCRFCIDEEVFEQLNATDFCNCCGARMDSE